MSKKFNDKAFRSWLREQMLSAIPPKMFRQKFSNYESESVFYEMVCDKACLRPEDMEVKRAYYELRGLSDLRINLYMAQYDIHVNFGEART